MKFKERTSQRTNYVLVAHLSLIFKIIHKIFFRISYVTLLQIMDAIKGTMTEIYNDLSKSTSGNTIAEVRVGPRPYIH